MEFSREGLAKQALVKAAEVRRECKISTLHPLNIYDICKQLEITVQFVSIPSIEGMYLNEDNAQRILISAHRPLPRKIYTCGHELGHHLFEHGSTMDELKESLDRTEYEPREFLVDCFSGFLLMPMLAILNAFKLRNWNPESASPLQFFVVACSFGVGYTTLIDHMCHSLRLLNNAKAAQLKKYSPKAIRQSLLGEAAPNALVIVDKEWILKTIDVEVGYGVLLPETVQVEGDGLSHQLKIEQGNVFIAERQGIVRVYCSEKNWSAFVRITRAEYQGLSEFRHIEENDDE